MRYLIQWHSVEPDLWRTYEVRTDAASAEALRGRLATAYPPASDWQIVAEGAEEPRAQRVPAPLTRLSPYEAEPGPNGKQPINHTEEDV